MSKLKQTIINQIYRFHFWLFKHEMSSSMKKFVLNLSYVTFSTAICAGIGAIMQIVAGRVIGPTEYGKFSLIVSIGNIISTFSLLGLNIASIYYLANRQQNRRTISAALFGVIINVTLVFILAYYLMPYWANALKINHDIAMLGLVFMVIYTFNRMSRAFLRGLNMIKHYAIYDITTSIIALASFFILIFAFSTHNYLLITISQFINYGSYAIFVFVTIRPHLTKFSKPDFTKLYSYGIYSFWGSIGFLILGNFDRLILNYYSGSKATGLYSAYVIASQAITYQLFYSFSILFFPTAAQAENKASLVKKLNASVIKLAPIIFIINLSISFIILSLFGKKYPLNLSLILLFSLNTLLYFIFHTYGTLLSSRGKYGAKTNAIYLLIAAALFIALSLFATPRWGISGVIISLLISYLYLTITQIYRANKDLVDQPLPKSTL